jgi:hypothetical protein
MAAEAVGFGLAAQVAMAVASAAAAKAVRIEAAGTGLAAAEVAGPEATAEAVETARTGMACTGMAGAGLADESFGAEAERLARPEEVGAKRTGCSAGGQYGRAAGGYRSRHRRGDPIPFGPPRDGVSPGSTSEQSAFPGIVALQSPFPGGAVRSNAFADSAFPRSAFADSVLPGMGSACRRSRHDAHPDIEFSDAELALVPFASPRRPDARRPPRHAAPSIGLRSRITWIGSRMTGLFATRALVKGARG